MQRRQLLQGFAALSGLALLPRLGMAAESPLIYLSPIKRDGGLSRCQAEVWFVGQGQDYYVVTAADAWRARALDQGLAQARVWVGDVGLWHRSDGKYLQLPSKMTRVSRVADNEAHTKVLAKFGRKYSAEWRTWGPRFKNGLADGSRVMLKYSPV